MIMGRQQKNLHINLPGNVFVFFKMTTCNECPKFIPIFEQLAAKDRRVNYAIVNVEEYRDIVVMSRQSTTPIHSVPTLILYASGRPHAKFTGNKNFQSLQKFISDALASIPQNPQSQQFMPHPQTQQNMYGGGYSGAPQGAPDPRGQMGPLQGQAGFNPQNTQQNAKGYYSPEIGNSPSLSSVIKGGSGPGGYAYVNQVQEEDDNKLMVPDAVIPYNTPWESEYRRLGD